MSISNDEIRLSPEQRSYIARIAEETGRSWTEVLSEALATYHPEGIHPKSESFAEAASRLGFVGCLKGGPKDLSTNSKYMEGFGEREF